ncbi:MAG: hypothetical protein WD397_13450 [Wenzhouxiangellaceae bacterium]
MNRQTTSQSNPNALEDYIDAVLAQPPGTAQADSAQRKLIARIDAEKTPSRHARAGWGWATAALAAVLLPMLMWMPGTNGGLVFADVQRFFTDFETLSARLTTTMREETILEMDIRVDAQDRVRLDAGGGFSYVIDPNRSLMLQLFHDRKQAMLMPLSEPGAVDEAEAIDWLEDIREFQGQAELLDETMVIGGQQAYGFSLAAGGMNMTLWATESGQPLRLQMQPTDLPGPHGIETRMDFEFDRPLDESLFSLTPPESYRLLGEFTADTQRD